MEKYLFIVCMVFYLQIVFSQSNNECISPNERNGICINIKRCPLLISLLENRRSNSSIVPFLRNSMCGYEGRDPKVCCPLEDNDDDKTTSQKTFDSFKPLSNQTLLMSRLPSPDTCGRTNTSRIRIVGGNPAFLGDWPWIAALGCQDLRRQNQGIQWVCGGALISERYVLTAAHCTVKEVLGNYLKLVVVRLGELNLDPNVMDGAEPIDVPIAQIISHKQYNVRDHTNDIALLKLDRSVSYTKLIRPICLPLSPDIRLNRLVKMEPFVAGWGATSYEGPSTNILMDVQLPVLDNVDCKQLYASKKSVIDDRVMCAGYLQGRKDSCQGDSGGPLMWPSKTNQYYLVGVVSFGYKCAEPGYPGVYTRVASFIEWIFKNINGN